jgi:DnaJ-domain-containing protein 1
MEQQIPTFNVGEHATKYEILGVEPKATAEELHIVYRRLALLYHPDRHPESEREAMGKIFARIASAYTTLSDPDKRRRYDLALSRNEEYQDRDQSGNVVSLADILAGIGVYEHMFSESSVSDISKILDEIVQKNLLRELGEEIVEAWPLPAAPSGAQHKGSFSNGALVLTNLRALFPYTFTWEETHGNVKRTYTGAGMPILPLPLLERILVVAEKRVRRKLWLRFQFKGEEIRISPRWTNLSKLLLVAQLWGVPIESRQEDAKWIELRWALLGPWTITLMLSAIAFAIAGVLGLFGDGMLDNVGDFSDFLLRWGVWQWTTVLVAAICGARLMRWVHAYLSFDLAESLRRSQ